MAKQARKPARKVKVTQDDDADTVQIFTRVPRRVRDGLKAMADEDERTLSQFHRRLLIQFVDEKESGR